MTPLHQTAREYAAAGIPVFPVQVGGKRPLPGSAGFKDATTDLATIDAWWEEADYNLAISPESGGWVVVDIDGPEGEGSWAARGAGPATYTVKSPHGRHLYYAGSMPPSASKIGAKLDIRGRGSYVLVPPSVVDGLPYTVLDDQGAVAVPAWVVEAAGKETREGLGSDVKLDLPVNVARARQFLANREPAVEGAGGDAWTLQTIYWCRDLGLSAEGTFKQLQDWNARCAPPWDADELQTKIVNAFTYAQNKGEAAWAVAPSSETFGAVLDKLAPGWSEAGPPEPKLPRFHLYSIDDLAALPPIEFLVPDMIPDESVGMLFGPPDSYKTFTLLTQLLGLAKEREIVYAAGEGVRGLWPRINAWAILNEVPLDDVKPRFHTARNLPRVVRPEDVDDFIAQIKKAGVRPAVVAIDTAARAMFGMDESSAKDAGIFLEAMDKIKSELGCTVVVIHHTGKDAARGARGSSAFAGGFDFVLEADADTGTHALSLEVRKMKDAERRRDPWTWELQAVAGSLALAATTPSQHKRLTEANPSIFSPGKVTAALQALGAHTIDEAAVTAHVLADKVLGPDLYRDEPEKRAKEVAVVASNLDKLAKTVLAEFRLDDKRWRIP